MKERNRVYAIFKKYPYSRGTWYRIDEREFKDPEEGRKEAAKCNGLLLIIKVKDENGYWHNISV